jgi:flagellar L-ring protein precursor FlgH
VTIAFSGGCTSYVENQASLEFDPIYLAATPQPDAVVPTGAIYKASSQGLFATDIRARGVGDILTVALAETFTATKSQSTSSSKADGFDIDLPVGVPESADRWSQQRRQTRSRWVPLSRLPVLVLRHSPTR